MLKAISLWQPWASLWATNEAKIHETRSWPTKHRGELAIHASKTLAKAESIEAEVLAEMCLALGFSTASEEELQRQYEALPTGGIIAVINLLDCRPTSSGIITTARDEMFGNWSPGRFAWERASEIHRLATPVACRGYQGIWVLAPEIEAQVRAQLPLGNGEIWDRGVLQ